MSRKRCTSRMLASVFGVVLAAAALAACNPTPPDGRELGLEVGEMPARLAVGNTVTIPVDVRNHGTTEAGSVMLAVLTSRSVEVSASLYGVACTEAGSTDSLRLVACPIGTIEPGSWRQILLTLSGAAVDADALVGLRLSSDGADPTPDPHPNTVSAQISVEEIDPVDLHVVTSRNPPTSLGGEPFDSMTTVANRGASPATDVEVSQTFPAEVVVRWATLERADGGAAGTCDIGPGSVRCRTDHHAIAPLSTLDDRWVLTASVAPASSAFHVTHKATSPHPEPDPDPWPNEVKITAYADRERLLVEPVGQVHVGEEFDVTFGFDPAGEGFGVAQYLSVGKPAAFDLVSFTANGVEQPCGPSSCVVSPYYFAGGVLRMRATAPTDLVTIFLSASWEGGSGTGSVTVQAVDPSVGSEIHPDLAGIDSAVVGERSVVAGVVRNSGGTDHQAVVVDVVGQHVDVVRWDAALLPCAPTATGARCELGTLAGHAVQPLRVELVPDAPGDATVGITVSSGTPQDDPDPVPDEQSFDYVVAPAFVDLGVALTLDPDPATLDVPLVVTAAVTNHGTIRTPGSDLVLTVPAGLPVTGVSSPTFPLPPGWGGCEADGQIITCDVGDIPAGATVLVEVETSVPSNAGGNVQASVSGGGVEPVPDPHPNSASVDVGVDAPAADIGLTLFTYHTPVVAGEPLELEYRVQNFGPSSTPATLVVELPAGWTVTSTVIRFDSGTCSIAGSIVTCELSAMHGPGGFRDLEMEVVAPDPGLDFPVTATVTAPLPDPGTRADTVTETFDVVAREADLSLSTLEHPAPTAGLSEYYSVRLRNLGPATLPEATLTATFPDTVQIDDVTQSHSGMPCSIAGQTVTCTGLVFNTDRVLSFRLTHLVPGEPVDYSFVVTSSVPEVAEEVGPNSLQVTRTPVAGDASLRVWVRDELGNLLPATVGVYTAADRYVPSYTATWAPGHGWLEVPALPAGEYRILISRPGFVSQWWDGQATRDAATPLVAAGLSERWDLDVVLESAP